MKSLKTMSTFLKLSYRTYKPLFLILVISTLVDTLFSVFTACFLSILVSKIEKDLINQALHTALIIVVVDGVLFIIKQIIDAYLNKCRNQMNERISHTLAAKIMSLPFSYLEDANYVQMKDNALMGVNNMGAIYSFYYGFKAIVSNVITIIALGVIIASFEWKLMIVLAIGIVLTIIITVLSTKVEIKFFNDLLPINFRYSYYINTLQNTSVSKDFRLYSIYDVIIGNLKIYMKEIEGYFMNLVIKEGVFSFLLSTIRYIVLAFVYITVGLKTITMNSTITQFTLTVSAAISFSSAVNEIVSAGGDFLRGVEYVKPIVEFMNIKEDSDVGTIELKSIDSIEFDHVSFTYPNTTEKVLDDISFTFHRNEKISIVGLNGAGKTTIVKLLCKLYKPDEGEIRINGLNIYEYTYESYMKQISSVFQDYKLFNYSIIDNIMPNISNEDCLHLIENVGLKEKISELPQGIDSYLGKSLNDNGIELSGGELQKIAIARALAKPADLLIMDEPTSALDPLAEAEIYKDFNNLAQDRTAIYISHRMSSSVFCDRILVLNNGKVEAFKTHEELMKNKEGLYYKMFMTQAENYQIA